jgi:hypothetical protein
MQLHAVLFESIKPQEYQRMADVLALSAAESSAGRLDRRA